MLYLIIGVCVALVGCKLHARAWGFSYRESFCTAWPLWLLGVLCWPLGLDMLLFHKGTDR